MGKTQNTGRLTNGIYQDSSNNIAIGDSTASGYKFKVTGTSNLNGALNGTSATFSSSVSGLSIRSSAVGTFGFNTANNGEFQIYATAADGMVMAGRGSTHDMVITNKSGSDVFRIPTGTINANLLGSVYVGGGSSLSTSEAALLISSNNYVNIGAIGTVANYSNNAYYNGSAWKYINTSAAANYYQSNGTHVWRYAGSGTAGNDISWSEAMRISNAGNVGIGTSSPSAKLQVGDLANVSGVLNDILITGDKVNANGYYARLMLKNSSQSGGSSASIRGERETTNLGTALTFYTNSTAGAGDGTERMRITSGGDLCVGKTSATWSSTGLQTESNGTALGVTSSSSANNFFLRKNGVTGNVAAFYYDGTGVGSISITSSTTTYSTSSDYRLKQDFKDFNGLNLISAIKTYEYEWKSDKTRSFGVIAHELSEVLPYAVVGEKDGEVMQGVDYSKIVPVLVKAIQEQQAQIEELKQLINV